MVEFIFELVVSIIFLCVATLAVATTYRLVHWILDNDFSSGYTFGDDDAWEEENKDE